MHDADRHAVIRVQGARENNLKDVSVEIPKRRLTVFTGISGSGKSSLVFATIAAESQRLINETYSAFLQGFMPTLARPEVDVLEGLTTAIIVDQERMGGNPRSTVGTATDANAMLRILFSRLGQPHIGTPKAFAFNIPSVRGAGAITIERGERKKTERKTFTVVGGMCPRCEGMGSVTDIDLAQLFDDSKSLAQGALTIPGYSAGGWNYRLYAESGFLDPDKPIRDYTEQERHDLLYREPVRVKIAGINMTYEGLVPRIQQSFLSKDVDAMQPHIRAFVERAVTFTRLSRVRWHAPVRRCPRPRRSGASASPTPAPCRSATWPTGSASLDEPIGRAAAGRPADTASMRSSRSGSGTSRSTGRQERSPAARRSASR